MNQPRRPKAGRSQRHEAVLQKRRYSPSLLDDDRAVEPPDSLPNSEVKRSLADGSVGSPHVRVGHRQAFNTTPGQIWFRGFFMPVASVQETMICSHMGK